MKALLAGLAERLRRLPPVAVLALGVAYTLIMAGAHLLARPTFSFILFYLLGIIFVAWTDLRWGLLLAALAASLGAVVNILQNHAATPPEGVDWNLVWNCSVRFLVFLAGAWLTAELRRVTGDLQKLVEQLKSANRALAARKAYLRLALDASSAGTWSWDAAGNGVTLDLRSRELFGFAPSEPISYETWMERVHPEDRNPLLTRTQTLLQPGSGDHWDHEFRVLHPARGPRWMHGLGRVERDAAGQATGLVGINLDITERKQAEAGERARLAQIEAIYQSAPVGLCVLDEQFRYVAMNEKLAAMNGQPVAEHLGRTVREVMPELAEWTESLCGQVMATGQPLLDVEITPALPGISRSFVTHLMPLKQADGRVTAVSLVIEETTERKQMEQALLQSEEKYRRLHESMMDAYASTDMSGRILDANPAFEALLGYTKAELSERTYMDLTPEKWHAPEMEILTEQVLTRGFSDVYEKEYRRKDGTIFPVELRTFLIRDDQGQPATVWGIVRDISGRKQAEAALRAQLEQIEAIYASAPVGLCVLDKHFRYVRINQRLAEINHMPVERHLGRTVREAVPALADGIEAICRQVLATGQPVLNQEFQRSRGPRPEDTSTGVTHWMPLRDADGQVTGMSVVVDDITERKHMEAALRVAHAEMEQRVRERTADLEVAYTALAQSEERYRSLVNNLNVGVFRTTVGLDARFIEANPALACLLGYESVEELRKLPASAFFHLQREMQAGMKELLRQGGLSNYQVCLRKKDGTLIDGSITSTLHYNPDGEADWVDGIVEDITERKRIEEALRASEERYRAVVEDQTEIITRFAPDGTFSFVNGAYCRFFGKTDVELLGQKWQPHPVAEDVPLVEAQLRRLSPEDPLVVVENRVYSATGEVRWMQFVNRGLFDRDGRLIETQSVGRDITDQKRAERGILEISEREQARIGQDLHDGLCQQLVSLSFDAYSLQRKLSARNEPAAALAGRVAELLDQAITESRRLARGLFPIRLEGEGLVSALEELARSIGRRFPIQCRFECPEPVLVQDHATATHLYRIVQEALNNAVKHARAANIVIYLRSENGNIHLRIEDDGIGFPREVPVHSRSMGLHIMQYRAAAIGATLHVSPGQARGTTITCACPLVRNGSH